MEIKVGILLSYDYDFLRTCLPLIYEHSDMIVLAKDKNCRTYTNNTFTISPDFYSWLESFDTRKIIQIYEDDFYRADMSLMDNEMRERFMMANVMGKGGWHIQLDADEYFINFDKFVAFLKSQSWLLKDPEATPVTYYVPACVLFKKLDSGYLVMNERTETLPIATNRPKDKTGRHAGGVTYTADALIVHHSWARSSADMRMKLYNWSHSGDFNMESYFKLWEAIDDTNYKYVKDFHPMVAGYWPNISFIPCKTVDEVNEYFRKHMIYAPKSLLRMVKENYYVRKWKGKISK